MNEKKRREKKDSGSKNDNKVYIVVSRGWKKYLNSSQDEFHYNYKKGKWQ